MADSVGRRVDLPGGRGRSPVGGSRISAASGEDRSRDVDGQSSGMGQRGPVTRDLRIPAEVKHPRDSVGHELRRIDESEVHMAVAEAGKDRSVELAIVDECSTGAHSRCHERISLRTA